MNQSLITTFDIDENKTPEKEVKKVSQEIIEAKKDSKKINNLVQKFIETDFNSSRDNVDILIQQGRDALFTAIQKAELTEDPRWYRAIAELLNSITVANKTIIDNHETITRINKNIFDTETPEKEEKSNITIDKAIFIGKTSDLIEQIKTINHENTE